MSWLWGKEEQGLNLSLRGQEFSVRDLDFSGAAFLNTSAVLGFGLRWRRKTLSVAEKHVFHPCLILVASRCGNCASNT